MQDIQQDNDQLLIDSELFQDTIINNPGWHRMVDRIKDDILSDYKSIIKKKNIEDIRFYAGRIDALQGLINYPQFICEQAEEIRKNTGKEALL